MAKETGDEAASKTTLGKLALPAAVAAVGAGLGLLFTRAPKRLREAIPELPRGARDLVGDLKERVESVGDASKPQVGGQDGRGDTGELESRRRERKKRRERRRQQATR
jgi:hypothetical protein